MAQVTVELRKLLQLNNFSLFDFSYKFDDPNFKAQLEQSVIDYYYNYEIGTETPQEFKRRFEAKWLSIIDYYNQLYNTTLLTYNPLINYKLTEALEQLATSNATSTSDGTTTNVGSNTALQLSDSDSTRTDNLENTSTGTGNEKTSDYPQQAIAGGDFLEGEKTSTTSTSGTNTGTQKTENTATTDTTSNTTTTATNKDLTGTQGTTNTNYEKTLEGLTGTSYQELIAKERQNLIRLIPMIISELKPLFILVY